MEPVSLRPAFIWTCPLCGTEHFERSVICEFTLEDQQEMQSRYGADFQTGDWVTAPETVECPHCEIQFLAMDSDCESDCESAGDSDCDSDCDTDLDDTDCWDDEEE